MRRSRRILFCMLVTLILSACGSSEGAAQTPTAGPEAVETTQNIQTSISPPSEGNPLENAARFDLSSDAFLQGYPIPEKYTCKGGDSSPQLTWDAPPDGTQSLVLIMDDPDAPGGTWTHWVLYNIPAGSNGFPQAVVPREQLDDGSLHGKNSWDILGYRGPCPPSGMHRYFFHLYALDTVLDLPGGVEQSELENAMAGHIIGYAELMGTFQK